MAMIKSDLYQRDKSIISRHLRNIFKSEERNVNQLLQNLQ